MDEKIKGHIPCGREPGWEEGKRRKACMKVLKAAKDGGEHKGRG